MIPEITKREKQLRAELIVAYRRNGTLSAMGHLVDVIVTNPDLTDSQVRSILRGRLEAIRAAITPIGEQP